MLGAIIGDIVGSRFEWNNHKSKDFEFLTYKCFPTELHTQSNTHEFFRQKRFENLFLNNRFQFRGRTPMLVASHGYQLHLSLAV